MKTLYTQSHYTKRGIDIFANSFVGKFLPDHSAIGEDLTVYRLLLRDCRADSVEA